MERKFPGPIYLFFFFIFSGPLISFMPDATETEFFERADMLDTKIGRSKKDAPTHRSMAESGSGGRR